MNTIMKRLSTIAAVLFSSALLTAQNNNLVVFSENGERFTLVLNGLRQNQKPETNVKVTGLNAEWYTAKIIFEKSGGKQLPDLNSKVGMMDGGTFVSNKEVTYSIINKKGKYKLRWNGTADIIAAPAANQVVYTFNPSGDATQQTTTTTTTGGTGMNVSVNDGMNGNVGMNVNVTGTGMEGGTSTTTTTGGTSTVTGGGSTTTTTTTTTTGTPDGMNVGMNMGGVGVNISVTGTGTGATTTQQTTTTTTSTSTTGGSTTVVNTGGTTAPVQTGCVYPMNSSDFASAKSSVQSKSFEDSKLTVAKQILSSNCMSTSQVKDIMSLFSFEETKLTWAKFAYGKTTDPNNYFKLNDAFTFEASIDELNSYISSQK